MRPTRWEQLLAWRPSLPFKLTLLLIGMVLVVGAAVTVVALYFLGYWGKP